jgi:hypothetical protein
LTLRVPLRSQTETSWAKVIRRLIGRDVPTGVNFARAKVGGKLIRPPGRAIFGKHPGSKAGTVKLDGAKVIEFPKLPERVMVIPEDSVGRSGTSAGAARLPGGKPGSRLGRH